MQKQEEIMNKLNLLIIEDEVELIDIYLFYLSKFEIFTDHKLLNIFFVNDKSIISELSTFFIPGA